MRKELSMVLAVAIALFVLAGCGKKEDATPVKEPIPVTEEIPEKADKPTPKEELTAAEKEELNAKAKDSFMQVLYEETALSVDESFGEDDAEGNYDVLLGNSQYFLTDLRKAMEADNGDFPMFVYYAMEDLNGDGISELVLRFENSDGSFSNWNGIVTYKDGAPVITIAYFDGYRTESTLYKSGYYSVGGSGGAYYYSYSFYRVGENGEQVSIFDLGTYFGPGASSAAYEIAEVFLPDEESYFETLGDSQLETELYTCNGEKRICFNNFSSDPAMRAEERKLADALVSLGAKEISTEEMADLTDYAPVMGETVEYTLWYGVEYKNEDILSVVDVNFLSENDDPDSCEVVEHAGKGSEYQLMLVLTTTDTVTDFEYLELEWQDIAADGTELYLARTTYKKDRFDVGSAPILVKTEFPGDMPNQGFRYTSPAGIQMAFAVSMSGYDGSLILTPICINGSF